MRISRDNWIILGMLLVVTATYVLVINRWQSSVLEDVRAQAATRERQLDRDRAKASRVLPMVRQIETMKQRYNKDWDRRLPQRQELAGFLREISSNLAEEKLINQMIRPGHPTSGPLYNVLPITMAFEGNFLSLAGFLRRVDEMTRLTRIEQLKIGPKKGSPDLQMEVGMNIYFTEQ
jgi:type IV pilus assembly protein PilO